VYSPAGLVPPPSHLTSYTPTKANLYLASSLETVIKEPALYKLLTFHVPNLISIFRSLGRLSKEPVQVRGSCKFIFYSEGFLASRPTPKLEDYPMLSVCNCLFNISAANLNSCRPFLHLQPEDAPRCGDRDPPNMEFLTRNRTETKFQV
jgi:hypothetical protein